MIALGIVSTREEVKRYMDQVDKDKSNSIEFDEFLLIMRDIKTKKMGEDSDNSLYRFFKEMIEGSLDKLGDMDNDIPFMLNFSLYRRKRILEGIMVDKFENPEV